MPVPTKAQLAKLAAAEYTRSLRKNTLSLKPLSSQASSLVDDFAAAESGVGFAKLARSTAIYAANERIALDNFKAAARQYLSGKVAPTGYATKRSKKAIKRSVVLLLSDLHLGAELSSLDNPVPFGAIQEARRLEAVVRQLLDYKPHYRANTEAVLLINGDIIDGNLQHDMRDGAPLTEQKVIFWTYFRQIIALVAQQFPSVRVIFQPGNHGRDIARHPGRATSMKWDCHEWSMYYALQQMCNQLPNVTWQLDFRAVSVISFYGQYLGMTHGDTEVKIGHPDSASERNASILSQANSNVLYGQHLSAWAFGHFHSPRYLPRSPGQLFNGALIPPNGHARTSGYITEVCGQWLYEAVEGHIIGDLRFAKVDTSTDSDEKLGKLIKPFRFDR
jgi:hypothetical protein